MKKILTAIFPKDASPFAAKASGMSLIEVVFFVALAGFLYATISQMVPQKKLSSSIDEVVLGLNSLCSLAIQESLCKNTRTQLEFKPSKNGIYQVRAKMLRLNSEQKAQFLTINNGFTQGKMAFPRGVTITNWQIGEQSRQDDAKNLSILFSPQGICQPVVIHLSANDAKEKRAFSLTLNPFAGQFKLVGELVPFNTAAETA